MKCTKLLHIAAFQNFLITLSAEGWCYLFDLSESSTAGADCDGDPRVMKPLHKQHLPANSKVMLLADVGKLPIENNLSSTYKNAAS